jgi:hypothetical protein
VKATGTRSLEVVEEPVADVAGQENDAVVLASQAGDFFREGVSHRVLNSSATTVSSSAVGMR